MSDYLLDAQKIIDAPNSIFIEEANAYVNIIPGSSSTKYAFVGLDRVTGEITTFHIKSVSELIRKFPSIFGR